MRLNGPDASYWDKQVEELGASVDSLINAFGLLLASQPNRNSTSSYSASSSFSFTPAPIDASSFVTRTEQVLGSLRQLRDTYEQQQLVSDNLHPFNSSATTNTRQQHALKVDGPSTFSSSSSAEGRGAAGGESSFSAAGAAAGGESSSSHSVEEFEIHAEALSSSVLNALRSVSLIHSQRNNRSSALTRSPSPSPSPTKAAMMSQAATQGMSQTMISQAATEKRSIRVEIQIDPGSSEESGIRLNLIEIDEEAAPGSTMHQSHTQVGGFVHSGGGGGLDEKGSGSSAWDWHEGGRPLPMTPGTSSVIEQQSSE